MPKKRNNPSALKRERQTAVRTERNKSIRTTLKNASKNVRGATDDVAETLQAAYSKLDKAVTKGTIHRNKAARTKSRLAKVVNKSAQSSS